MNISEFHPSHFFGSPEIVKNIYSRFVEYFPEGGEVADLGCGEGAFLELLKTSGRKGTGVDITEKFITELRARGFDAVQQDVLEFLRSHSSEFDGIFASHLIEHFPAGEGLQLLELMYQALRPHGIMFVMTPSYQDILVSSERFWLDLSHVRPYPLPLLEALFQHLGLEIIDKGYEEKTRIHPSIIHPRSTLRHYIAKLRFGKLYNAGDAFIVGKKR